MANETAVSRDIREGLRKAFPWLRFTRLQCGMAKGMRGGLIRLSDSGWPDYIGYLPDGRFFGLEIKDPKGRTKKSGGNCKIPGWRTLKNAAVLLSRLPP